ncbi:TPA: LPXTG cell wall anchor domain-containing protein [Listeria innocua]|nr:LPXTG cell wall anchor domain-containing protein [Listeria innocua]EED2042423.1 LPXTG cell wall anchor domain-containing protein [Listeria innocua]EKJ8907057.1 LPXTG cell wall anchor domain-containing protein [Listeria innocua]EKJ8909828.1 LPXTG cell wall anchor domain-containing protein [Listeria innocua]EKJ8914408.1 LPXTG cell wall anchor domain-containing protein [Listeria innocua]
MRKKRLIFISLCFFGIFFLHPTFVDATEGRTEIEVNILSDSSIAPPSDDLSSEKKELSEEQKKKTQSEEFKHSIDSKELNVIEKINNLLPKTGSKNQYDYIIFGIILTLISGGFIIKKHLEEKSDEKN